jgi:hypothetical protein
MKIERQVEKVGLYENKFTTIISKSLTDIITASQ